MKNGVMVIIPNSRRKSRYVGGYVRFGGRLDAHRLPKDRESQADKISEADYLYELESIKARSRPALKTKWLIALQVS